MTRARDSFTGRLNSDIILLSKNNGRKGDKMYNRNFSVSVRRTLAALISAALILVTVWGCMDMDGTVYADGSLNVEYHSQAQISARIKGDGVSMEDPLNYAVAPQCTAPYSNVGVLAPDTLGRAIKMMNQIRYIAGLSDNVTLNDGYNRKAQAAAMVNYANGGLSHYPTRPAGMDNAVYELGYAGSSSSNIAMASWNCSFNWTIVQSWMEDGDYSNIDRVGHRRWILNPSMGQTGFGAVYGPGGTYSALYCFDETNSSAWQTQVAWPAQNMPVGYFGPDFPWTVSMGKSVDRNSVQVSLVRVNDGMTWKFSSGASNGYFNVDNAGYGQRGCIIFRPDGIAKYNAGDVFAVSIKGGGVNLSYTVNFFDPDNVQPEDVAYNVDWAAANAKIDTAPAGTVADIVTGYSFNMPVDTLNKIAGKNILCAFHADASLVVSMHGAGVKPAAAPWQFAVSYKSAIPKTLLDQMKGKSSAVRTFGLASNVSFPAPINLHVVWGADSVGKEAVLYRYSDASGTLSEAGRFVIVAGGQSVFTVNGPGQYVAVVSK